MALGSLLESTLFLSHFALLMLGRGTRSNKEFWERELGPD